MKNSLLFLTLLLITMTTPAQSNAQTEFVKVAVDEASVGKITVTPKLPEDGSVAVGTQLTLRAIPQQGATLDALYYSYPGAWGTMYSESMEDEYSFVVEKEIQLGASFIATQEVDHIDVTQNIVYAQPGVKPLKYDVFSPKQAKNLPLIIIIHGGGWSSNTEDIMRGLARELTRSRKFVVASLDYRWLNKLDGDTTENQMHHLIEDVYGGILHIQEHAATYGGDGNQIFVTGDSAGGHLSSSVANMIEFIGAEGFGAQPGVFELQPTYMPKNKTIDEARNGLLQAIKGAAPSYGVFDTTLLGRFVPSEGDYGWHVAPINKIPLAKDRSIPQFLTRGTLDQLIVDKGVAGYTKALEAAGQRVEYVQVGGAGHAFFDWKPDARTKATFYAYGVYYAQRMEAFFSSVLEENQK